MSNDQTGANAEALEPNEGKKADQKVMISSYTILIVITLLVGVATIALAQVLPGAARFVLPGRVYARFAQVHEAGACVPAL